MGKCNACGYEFQTYGEELLYEQYGCAKTIVTRDMGLSVEMCSIDRGNGRYYAPGTDPNLYIEDPNSLKEGIINMLETNKALEEQNKKKYEQRGTEE